MTAASKARRSGVAPASRRQPDAQPQGNLYQTLRAGFPADLDAWAIECAESLDGRHFTWRDLDRASGRLANWLQSLALPPGARVAVQVEKSVESMLLYLAVLRSGLVHVPLNPAYRESEMAHFLADAEPALLVMDPAHAGWLLPMARQLGVAHCHTLGADRTGSVLEAAAGFADDQQPVPRQSQDLAAILYTSGTTGRSKGAMLSHGHLRANAQTLQQLWGWRGDDVLLHVLPTFHVHGLFVAFQGALLAGARQIWFNRFEPDAAVGRLKDATVFMGVPTHYSRLLACGALDRAACGSMRLFISGSAPLLPQTFQAFAERTGHTILERYGMSETLMLCSNPWVGEGAGRVAGSVGFPLPGLDLRVRSGLGLCLPGEVGSIEVKGPSVFSGYWRLPGKTAEEFTADGYFITGDVGYRDEHGRVFLVGRAKDLIISGGMNLYPAEIEQEINALPGVAESAVVAMPDPDFGEVAVAAVVPQAGARLTEQRLIQGLKPRLARFKHPKRVLITHELPRNSMGKVQKALLREQLAALWAPASAPGR